MRTRYDAVLAALNAGVVIHGADTEILEANPRARDLLGITGLEGRLATDPAWEFLEEDRSPMVLERFPVMQVIATQAPVRNLIMIIKPTHDRETWVEVNAVPILDDEGTLQQVAVTFIDITEHRLAADKLVSLATRDPLTGLANRATLQEEITLALAVAQRSRLAVGILVMDLDRFKQVNEVLGHSVGDQLLVLAAQRVATLVRAGDLVARVGGDEFVVVMRDLAEAAEAARVAGRIVEAFRAPIPGSWGEAYATASVGIAVSAGDVTAEELLREADIAMYAAKNEGGDRLSIFNEELSDEVATRMRIERDLRRALAQNELAVWYQPEVDLLTGRIEAAEALLRWTRPDGDIWTADRFIDVAEATGLILDIGDWVLAQACAQAADWARERPGRPVGVRVNVSAMQLAEAGLLQAVDEALSRSGLEPSLLCIEITETALLRRTATAASNLTGLHERGIALALDDFGTGYASLTYLDVYPVDVIKIDRSFVSGDSIHNGDYQLVAGILALAEKLDMSVVAEGVERTDQAERLCQLGCRRAQGWLFSKAVPASEFARMIEQPLTPSHAGLPPIRPERL